MFCSLRTPRGVAIASTTLALVVAQLALAASPAAANPAGTGLVVTEAYLNGGSAGATYTNKYVEIYNPTAEPIPLAGLSVQYRAATGTGVASTSVPLTGDPLAAGDFHVVQGGSNGAVGAPVPNVDQVSSINPSGTAGTLFVATGTAAVNPGTGSVTSQVDLLGYGSSNTFEGAATSAASTSTTLQRDEAGTDTDVNADDFIVAAPTPGTPFVPPDEVDATIAEIQGTGAESPHVGDIATTTGVVTAVYPTGGFNGFYIQTGGTGGATDATPGASDGLFVFGQGFDETTIAIGDSLQVRGPVSEFFGTTEITVTDPTDVEDLATPLAPVTPLAVAYPSTVVDREAHEGELMAPTNEFTVTNTFTTNRFAEIGLATGTTPLIQPTDVEDAQTGDVAGVIADNAARAVTLDDGASIDFLPFNGGPNQDIALPWLSPANPIRVGATATLEAPVIIEFRNNAWKFQPTGQVTDEGTDVASFENTRVDNTAPQDVGGDLQLATFNVLNYFNTTGMDFIANGGACTFFFDRDGDEVANNNCTPDGPRGAAEDEDFQRQQVKIVNAINTTDADIVSLEEIENSIKLLTETDRDDALAALVDALNTDAGEDRWAFVPTPDATDLPPAAEQDVIRNAFIYDPSVLELVGESQVLVGSLAFDNAREPLAQAFKLAGGADADAFAVIVNHFKSKGAGGATGDNVDTGDGQGAYNGDRTRQAQALATFADEFATSRGTDRVFLTGDFNSYTQEDPMQVLYAAGYTNLESDTPDEYSYSFSGLSGSLDHVLANDDALATVTGVDIWETNANESVAFQYSRFNYNLTQFFEADNPFAASDHNPEVVGIEIPEATSLAATAEEIVYGTDGAVVATVTPATATGEVEVLDGTTSLGTATLDDGTATVPIDGTALAVGDHVLTVRYAGSQAFDPSETTVTVRVVKATPRIAATPSPTRVIVGQGTSTFSVSVNAAGYTPTGTVRAFVGGSQVASAELDGGTAELDVGPFANVGTAQVQITYSGDAFTTQRRINASVRVVKATPTITVTHTPNKIIAKKTKVTLTVEVGAPNVVGTGIVKIRAAGQTFTKTLRGGVATVRLPKYQSTGERTAIVRYFGDSRLEGGGPVTHTYTVRPNPNSPT